MKTLVLTIFSGLKEKKIRILLILTVKTALDLSSEISKGRPFASGPSTICPPPPQIFRPYDGPERKLYWYQFFQKTSKNSFLDEMRTHCLNTWRSQFGDQKISGRSQVIPIFNPRRAEE